MPVLDRPEIKKEDLGELAKIFSQDISPILLDQMAVAHFYLTPDRSMCVDSSDYETGLIDAKPTEIQKYAVPEKFVAIYDSTSDNGTHRIAIYEKQTKNAKVSSQNTPVLEEAR